jgi:hypothetical protein
LDTLDTLIGKLVTEIRQKDTWLERARQDGSRPRMEACQYQGVGFRVALGHALFLRERGVVADTPADATIRANQHLAQL